MIYAVINQKGGVGKTTTAAALAVALARKNKKVLAVDMDAQSGSIALVFGAKRGTNNSVALLKGTPAEDLTQTIDGVDIIPGDSDLANLESVLTKAQLLNKYALLKIALEKIRSQYDYIIIDAPPSLGVASLNALIAADELIIPTEPDTKALSGLQDLNEVIETVREAFNPDLKIAGILITRYKTRTKLARELSEVAEDIAAQMGTRAFNARIREASAIGEAHTMQRSIFDYAKNKPVTQDYLEFIDELLAGEGKR